MGYLCPLRAFYQKTIRKSSRQPMRVGDSRRSNYAFENPENGRPEPGGAVAWMGNCLGRRPGNLGGSGCSRAYQASASVVATQLAQMTAFGTVLRMNNLRSRSSTCCCICGSREKDWPKDRASCKHPGNRFPLLSQALSSPCSSLEIWDGEVS